MSTQVRGSSDPTSTKTLREREFRPAVTKRFRALKGVIRETLVGNNALDLTAAADDMSARQTFVFSNEADAEDEFMDWLTTQIDAGVLEPMSRPEIRSGQHYTGSYVRAANRRGWDDAGTRLADAGVDPDDLEDAFNAPVPTEQLERAYTRTYSELDGITNEMEREIRRELSDGISQGRSNAAMVRNINGRVDKTGITDAERLVRTEVINSYNEQALTRFEMAGVEEVTAEVELLTAGDSRVCDICASLEGTTYTVKEARGIIPGQTHPNCRCTWVPVIN